ncbi:MAG: hypothetical protein KME11_20205 [Timaviella obliquedivisa GSE-PSE-MK23-08B]|nr:hypothetical protein [Timaviella obliquedivisa GSE-PSE-MK23-08B]
MVTLSLRQVAIALQELRHRQTVARDALPYLTKTLMYLPLANGTGALLNENMNLLKAPFLQERGWGRGRARCVIET